MSAYDEVMAVEERWTRAHRESDAAAIAELMADDYLRIETDGSLSDRNATLARFTPETRAWELAEGDEYVVRVYGDTAVVIGRWRARGVHGDESFDYAARFMSIYVKREGRWQMVAEQTTPME